MNLIQKIKMYLAVKKAVKENKMLGAITMWLNGKKTYLLLLLWTAYKVGVSSGWWPESPQIEAVLLGGAGIALREGVSKSEKKG